MPPADGPRIGRPPSDDPMQIFTCRMPRSMAAELDAARGERTKGDVTREAIRRWLETVKRQPRAR